MDSTRDSLCLTTFCIIQVADNYSLQGRPSSLKFRTQTPPPPSPKLGFGGFSPENLCTPYMALGEF